MRTDFEVDAPPATHLYDLPGDREGEALAVEEVEEEWTTLSRDCDGDFL